MFAVVSRVSVRRQVQAAIRRLERLGGSCVRPDRVGFGRRRGYSASSTSRPRRLDGIVLVFQQRAQFRGVRLFGGSVCHGWGGGST
eukprot:517691-Lingulodinium_polyedra.AAC.1